VKSQFMRALGAALLLSCAPATFAVAAPTSATVTSPEDASLRLAGGVNIPAAGRFILVDAASAQLFMIDDGQIRDSMKVIVGKSDAATPEIESVIHFATLNPYWHVPTDMARRIIAPRVLKEGTSYLRKQGYEVISAFAVGAEVLKPESIDWRAVAAGKEKVYVRQLPGPRNSMGQLKFGFDNDDGIFLHDTPQKELFAQEQRNLSGGCIRLEDARRLASWLMEREPAQIARDPEQHVRLPQPVPIRIAYLNSPASVQLAGLR
jgi:L,D-transpeptidase YcbB